MRTRGPEIPSHRHLLIYPSQKDTLFLYCHYEHDYIPLQVCLESGGDETWERELRALEAAAAAHPQVRPFLVTLDASPPTRPLPDGLSWVAAARWLPEEV